MKSKLIKDVRERKNITQDELAKVLGCSGSRIAMLESDKYDADLCSKELVALAKYDSDFSVGEYLEIDVMPKEVNLQIKFMKMLVEQLALEKAELQKRLDD